jgi:hypothetical protein
MLNKTQGIFCFAKYPNVAFGADYCSALCVFPVVVLIIPAPSVYASFPSVYASFPASVAV